MRSIPFAARLLLIAAVAVTTIANAQPYGPVESSRGFTPESAQLPPYARGRYPVNPMMMPKPRAMRPAPARRPAVMMKRPVPRFAQPARPHMHRPAMKPMIAPAPEMASPTMDGMELGDSPEQEVDRLVEETTAAFEGRMRQQLERLERSTFARKEMHRSAMEYHRARMEAFDARYAAVRKQLESRRDAAESGVVATPIVAPELPAEMPEVEMAAPEMMGEAPEMVATPAVDDAASSDEDEDVSAE